MAQEKNEPEKKKEEPLSWGCIGCLWLPGLLVFFVLYLFGAFDDFNTDDYDDDCNDSYIEQDYNSDGEEDAEDFRIQTEAC